MITINYPAPDFNVKNKEGKECIFDSIRKKWLVLTPEEWVRQNFIQYLIKEKKYPMSLIAIEKEITLGELKKRFDILIYDKNHKPWMMVECKAMEIKLDQKVLEQVLRYNISVPVKYLLLTNGNSCFAWKKKNDDLIDCNEIPEFEQ